LREELVSKYDSSIPHVIIFLDSEKRKRKTENTGSLHSIINFKNPCKIRLMPV
jgi:hypothetical protein